MARTPKKASAKQAAVENPAFSAHKKRVAQAWADKDFSQKLYDDACEFAMPYRRPSPSTGGPGRGQSRSAGLFDQTAVTGTFRAAGKLKEDLFPSGQQSFQLAPGPLAVMARPEESDQIEMRRQLEQVSAIVAAFMELPEFDNASNEMCLDLQVGQGALFIIPGDRDNPVRFFTAPIEQIALEDDAYGAIVLVSWRSHLTRRQIIDAFPDGVFPAGFDDGKPETLNERVEITQDFYKDPTTKRWTFGAWLEKSTDFIATDEYRAQPVATPRYYRVPGEAFGRGPVLLALPTIKTLNKAMELYLKAAAMQMFGIWGYRPGAFNPDTARLAPGEFWGMDSTGGVLGPDVTRLDTASGRIDVSQLITEELRIQVRSALGDEAPPEVGATPRSATEWLARAERVAQNYLGAFGRLVNETHPVIVRRVIEILYDFRMLNTDLDINTLLVKVDVLSPIAAALKARHLQTITDWLGLVATMRGEEALDFLAKVDDALRHIGQEMGVPPQFIMTEPEKQALQRKIETALQRYTEAQAASGAADPAGAALEVVG